MSSRHHCINNTNSNNTIATMMEGSVLWISCGPLTEKQIYVALRKGLQVHNLVGSSSSSSSSSPLDGSGGGSNSSSGGGGNGMGKIHIVSIPLELADAALLPSLNNENNNNSFLEEGYLKQLHRRIVHWLSCRELLSQQQQQQNDYQNKLQKQQQSQENKNKQPIINTSMGPNLIIIDNATTLGTLFGDALTNAFLSSVRASLGRHAKRCNSNSNSGNNSNGNNLVSITNTNLLTLRCTSPDDGGLYQLGLDDDDDAMNDNGTPKKKKGEQLRSEHSRLLRPWLGMGSGVSYGMGGGGGSNSNATATNTSAALSKMEEQSNYLSLSSSSALSDPRPLLYQCGLYEIADGIVDVSPLESGYARDVLGRLSFATTWSGKGWWGTGVGAGGSAGVVNTSSSGGSVAGIHRKKEECEGAYSSICVNYRCDDSGVRVMRLRSR